MMTDMTKGSPAKLILAFTIPILIGNLFQQFYSMVDTAIVGQFVGVGALAAVGATGGVIFLVQGFVNGLTHGFSVIVSQRYGANDELGIKKATATSIYLSAIATVVLTVICVLLAKPVLQLMNTPVDILEDATSYVTIFFGGLVSIIVYNLLASLLRAFGDSKTPLYFLILASITNIILDLVLIINFKMGVAGAAIATVVSQGLSGLLCYFYMIKKFDILTLKKEHFKYDPMLVKELMYVSLPMALQYAITAIGVMILQVAVNSFGSTTVAAFTAATKVEQLVVQPGIAIGMTMATYAAQNLGARRIDRVRQGARQSAWITIVTNALSSVIVIFLGGYIVQLFIPSANVEALPISMEYLKITAIFYPVLGLLFLYRFALQGLGNTVVPMFAGVMELVMRTIVAFTLPGLLGYQGVCLASPLAWIGATVWLIWSYFRIIPKLERAHPIENLE
ncbi:MATE family efflux transporter [Turicibacter sp. 1E2]|uniref:MATE family efflux transporter n=1 Tax=Turicibacter sp. 1E2 TaxID=2951143 RepID=UPI0021D4D161|nr:MATE family efflux transporter [Turicibacter sp. 1E2]MCU7208497.1 MATE family efflux transporter [Turicibacter sp. 1E2]